MSSAGVELRALTSADIPAWAALLNACAVADGTDEHYSDEDLEEELANPEIDVERDTVAAVVDGRLTWWVPYAAVGASSRTHLTWRVPYVAADASSGTHYPRPGRPLGEGGESVTEPEPL